MNNILLNLYSLKRWNLSKKKGLSYKRRKKYRAYVLDIPEHGNLGDQAIAIAEMAFLKKFFSDYEVLEFSYYDIPSFINWIKNDYKEGDIVFLHGGGNMGNMYPVEEDTRQKVISKLKDCKIVIFPQTIDFRKDRKNYSLLYKSKKIYNNHSKLTLIAREKESYKLMQKYFPKAKVILNPDIVFFLSNYKLPKLSRDQIVLTIRNDQESRYDFDTITKFYNSMKLEYSTIKIQDTVVGHKVNKNDRVLELNSLLLEFARAKFVVTDRLHGMILAAITQTPCIVTSALDHKVRGTYEWIKDLNYIDFANSLDSETIISKANKLEKLTAKSKINVSERYFPELAHIIREK